MDRAKLDNLYDYVPKPAARAAKHENVREAIKAAAKEISDITGWDDSAEITLGHRALQVAMFWFNRHVAVNES